MPSNMKKTVDKGTFEYFSIQAYSLEDQDRIIYVYLPPHFHDGYHEYPVLYMHDGQNLFFNNMTTFKNGAWAIHKTLNQIYSESKQGFMVVGIKSSNANRDRELSLLPIKKHSEYAYIDTLPSQSEAYIDFLLKELKPIIDLKYHTDHMNSYIGGSSMGGICSLLMAMRHPQIFRGALCFSPAGLLYEDEVLKEEFKKCVSECDIKRMPYPKLYFMVGGKGIEQEIKPFCDWAVPYLASLGYDYAYNLYYTYRPRLDHNEKAWARIFPHAFRWLIDKKY